MAHLTSHILNGADGTHAGGVGVVLTNQTTGKVVLESATDSNGRLGADITVEQPDIGADYQLMFSLKDYWHAKGVSGEDLINEIVLRFTMADPNGLYHMPVIVSPHSYSTWKSSNPSVQKTAQ